MACRSSACHVHTALPMQANAAARSDLPCLHQAQPTCTLFPWPTSHHLPTPRPDRTQPSPPRVKLTPECTTPPAHPQA